MAALDQVDKGMLPYRDHLALLGGERVIAAFRVAADLQTQRQLQRTRAYQPQHQPRVFQAAQQRAGEDAG